MSRFTWLGGKRGRSHIHVTGARWLEPQCGRLCNVVLDLTSQAFGSLLDTFGNLSGRRFLDVACGTGHLVNGAADRGAVAEGLDISPEMVAQAAQGFPAFIFVTGSADALPYDDETFDAVTCCFGLLHMERPEKAVEEIYRVLRPGGRFSYTTWQSPAAGGALLGILLRTFQRFANMEVGLPPAPPMFQFSEAETRDPILNRIGFTMSSAHDLDIRWRAKKPEEIEHLLKEGMVRVRLLFERQLPSVQDRIIAAVIEEARTFQNSGGVEIPNVAHLATATKPKT